MQRVRVSGGHLCVDKAATEPAGETGIPYNFDVNNEVRLRKLERCSGGFPRPPCLPLSLLILKSQLPFQGSRGLFLQLHIFNQHLFFIFLRLERKHFGVGAVLCHQFTVRAFLDYFTVFHNVNFVGNNGR